MQTWQAEIIWCRPGFEKFLISEITFAYYDLYYRLPRTVRVYLFRKVVNIITGSIQDRVRTIILRNHRDFIISFNLQLISGRYHIREVKCKKCERKLGWMYEYAFVETEKYKEGCIILEKALIRETEGLVG